MRSRLPRLIALVLLGSTASAAAAPLRARFIGNAAVEITDGQFTLLTDFPYQSGAFGYMKYDPAAVAPRGKSVCLITHAHKDHFAGDLAKRIGCKVVGPPSVVKRAAGQPAVTPSGTIREGPLTITAVPTRHGAVEHNSYLVEWNGLRLYFTGDTESTAELARQERLDVLFVSPWLMMSAKTSKSLPAARSLVVYHHRDGELFDCAPCIVPRPGDDLPLPAPKAAGRK